MSVMENRVSVIFKLHGEVVIVENRDLFLNEIDVIKHIISSECQCNVDEIEVEFDRGKDELSEIDVTSEGMVFWTALNHVPIKGVYCILEEGSDEHLDAINNGTLINHINFFI